MKISISVLGRFHAFNMAQQLVKRGRLEQLITSYPKFFAIEKFNIPKEKITSILSAEILKRGLAKLPPFTKDIYNTQLLISNFYDKLASHKVRSSDIFIGFSSVSLYSLRKAKSLGAKTILERGSSHIVYQNDILKEEYEKYGLRPDLPHPEIIKKELREYEEADYVEVPSVFVKNTFIEKGFPAEKLIHVPYGVDLSLFKPLPKKDNVFRVIFGGGLSLRKGTHYLLKSFSELNLKNSELLLAGPVNEEIVPFLKKYAGHYKRIDYVPFTEINKIFSQGTVFVMPSIEEGLALIQPIAMACGLPVICTTNTGGEDIIRDGLDGFVIPIRSVEKIKEKILYFYENPEAAKMMGDSARLRVSSGFTWDDYGAKVSDIYENILKNKGK
ncbi:MAG: glycosyltransferase family 4 protein [Candidatus Paceibacterota bacterium]